MVKDRKGESMKIGQISRELNIPSATLRYYEQIGLLENINKKNGVRNYTEEDIERIKFIICMKKAGFTLEDILTFLRLEKDKEKVEQKRLDMLLHQKEVIIEKMKEQKETLNFLNYKINLYEDKLKKKKVQV